MEQGVIPGAVGIVRGNLEAQVENRLPEKDATIVVHCAGGVRSAFAVKTLESLGYTDLYSMDGGFNKWKDEDESDDEEAAGPGGAGGGDLEAVSVIPILNDL